MDALHELYGGRVYYTSRSGLSGAELVRTRFEATPEAEEELTRLEQEHPGAVIIRQHHCCPSVPGESVGHGASSGVRESPAGRKEIKMSRELKRVPISFEAPLKQVWKGYVNPYYVKCPDCTTDLNPFTGETCPTCNGSGIHPDFKKRCEAWEPTEPPRGEGYQLWETVSEGSPISPVFLTLEQLCEWAESNATVVGRYKATKERWKEMLEEGIVYHQKDGFIFM